METTVYRVKHIKIGEKKYYNPEDLDGYYFTITTTDASGVTNDISLHCNDDCTFEGECPKWKKQKWCIKTLSIYRASGEKIMSKWIRLTSQDEDPMLVNFDMVTHVLKYQSLGDGDVVCIFFQDSENYTYAKGTVESIANLVKLLYPGDYL